jgi:hypothetical protein
VAARAYWKGKSPRWVIAVRCLSCRHRGVIAEGDLVRFGIKPGAPVASNACAAENAAATASWRNQQLLKASPDLKGCPIYSRARSCDPRVVIRLSVGTAPTPLRRNTDHLAAILKGDA